MECKELNIDSSGYRTAFTYCFMEIHWWEVFIDVMTIVLVAGKLLEPLWGAIEVSTVGIEIPGNTKYQFA